MFLDYYYIAWVLPAVLVALFAQIYLKSTFNSYRGKYNARGYTGAQVARKLLDDNGLSAISIERVEGELTDHFDSNGQVVRLSASTYDSQSVAALGVAAHEVGHAIQYKEEYTPIKIRSALVPVTNIGASLSFPLILVGLFLSADPLIYIGIALYSLMTLFQLVTLPVELNASNRAMVALTGSGILFEEEAKGARKVLTAAAFTYVAALLVSLVQLLRLIAIFGRRRD